MESRQEERLIYDGFLISVLLKGAISLAEVISGIALFFIAPATIVGLGMLALNYLPVASLQAVMLSEIAKYTAGTVTFVALYFISRGAIKIVLIAALLRNMLWAYPASLFLLGLFVLYQFYQLVVDHSLLILGITLFDLVVMYFIYREWQIVRALVEKKSSSSLPS